MTSLNEVRGTGVRLTLPYVLPFSGVWLVVSTVVVMVFAIACYLLAPPKLDDAARARLALILAAQTVCLIAAVVALAIFTTHRLAGPYVALKRAFEAVKNGDLERPLRFRRTDVHLRELEASFYLMLAALRERLETEDRSGGRA